MSRKQIDIQSTVVFERNYEALFNSKKRFIINEGSSRSSKTVSICQLLIVYALKHPNKSISIIRKTLPALRATAMVDFFDQMKVLGLYETKNHNKTNNFYTFDNGTIVSFFSADDSQKLRGRKSSICWLNESNELFYDDFVQLNLRTEEKIILDYNPSDSSSWIYELPADDSISIHSIYKDNPFLAREIVRQIEAYKDTDPELYQVFGLGLRINGRQNVYAGWEFIDEKPERFTQFVYGADYGFVHPTSIVKIWYFENELFIEELLYETHLTSNEIVDKMNGLIMDKTMVMVAEVARPEINADIMSAGYSVINADKSIKAGINAVKSFKIYVHSSSKNVKKEFENYKWKKQGDRILDEPIKLWDDAMDSIRYAVLYIKNNLQYGAGLVFN